MRNKMIVIMFLAYIVVFSVGSLIAKDRVFSDMENRNLEQFPKVDSEAILDGSFTEQFESYMSDQIIFKDHLVRIKVAENRVLNQTFINGVYFAEDGMLIQDYVKPYNQLSKNIQYVNEFVEANPDLSYTWLVIPNACYIYQDRLPAYATCYDQQEVMGYVLGNASGSMQIVDCSQELLDAKDEYIFYNTDHHWTMNGAYIGYTALCNAMGLNATPKDDYDIIVGSSDFLGTQYSNAPAFGQKPDEVLIFNNPEGEYKVEYIDDNVTTDSLYNYDNLNIKDKYTVYLDGNHSYLRITSNCVNCNAEGKAEDKLLVIKDSYAHCLLPLLADNYSEIYVVDLRYYHQSVSELARDNGITQVLFINNLEFLSTDDNFLWLQ